MKIPHFVKIQLHSPIDQIISLFEGMNDFYTVKNRLLSGQIEPFIWWMFFLSLSIILLILIFYLLWLIIKNIVLIPDHSDRKNFRKAIVEIIIILGIHLITGIPIFYPLLNIENII